MRYAWPRISMEWVDKNEEWQHAAYKSKKNAYQSPKAMHHIGGFGGKSVIQQFSH